MNFAVEPQETQQQFPQRSTQGRCLTTLQVAATRAEVEASGTQKMTR